MNSLRMAICAGLVLRVLPASAAISAQQSDYAKQVELDAQGNIFVSSDEGKLILMANVSHCSEVREAEDRQTIGCRVIQDPKAGNSLPNLRLEVYTRGGRRQTIEPGAPIGDWHFWKLGQQVVIYSGSGNGQGTYALYDSATARLLEKLDEPSDESLLPQWAKSQAQIQDESVPTNDELKRDRMMWRAKILRQISKIQPGMQRKDLLKVFTIEGGLSSRTQRTYVHLECPLIKVTVRFKAPKDDGNDLEEEDDVIESISQPYLQGSIMD